MPRILKRLSMAAVLLAGLTAPAAATLNCLHRPEPFALSQDTVNWSMTIVPGGDCIQGLRWSYMQIENVAIASAPRNGKVVLVGPGFRYYADPEFQGSDSFTVTVSGKNRKSSGNSTLQIEIKSQANHMQLSSSQP
jgi:Bacterial Ig domain